MAIPFLNHLDLRSVSELRNALLHLTTEASASDVEGKIIYDTGSNTVKYYDGSSWISLSGSSGTVTSVTSGNTNTITIGGTATDPTVAANTAAVTNGSANLATGDQIYDFVIGLGYITGNETITLSGDVTGSGTTAITTTIASAAVEAGMLNNNVISGQTELASGLVSTDELLVSDAGTIKRMDISVLETYMQNNLTFTNDTNTTYDLNVQAGAANTSIIRLAGSDATNDDVTISGTSTTVKVTESGNTITLDLQDDVTIANDLTVTGDLTVSGTTTTVNTETILLADNIITLNSNYTGSTPSENGGIEIERGTIDNAVLRWNETSDRWEFTNDGGTTYYNIPISTEYNNYTHPTHPGDDFSVDTGALTGAVIVSDIDINVTTDTLGHVTDANGTVSTRTLTLGDLGYTGATDADNYSSWTIQDGDTTTYTITSGDTLQIASGGGITSNFTADDVLTISHNDTSSQASVNNSGRTYIQDITLDTYGHVTGITSATETVTNTDTQLATAAALIDVSAMGSNTTASFTHSLASKNLIVQMYDVTTGEVVFADIDHTSNNAISIIFASTPTNDIRVVVIDAKNGLTDKTVSYS